MRFGRHWAEVAERRRVRREREDACPRLQDVVPRLERLHIEVNIRREGLPLLGTAHVRRYVVAQAPALFVLACTDTTCVDGGHDVTDAVVASLKKSLERFEVQHACNGQVGPVGCQRVLHLVVVAGYRPGA